MRNKTDMNYIEYILTHRYRSIIQKRTQRISTDNYGQIIFEVATLVIGENKSERKFQCMTSEKM